MEEPGDENMCTSCFQESAAWLAIACMLLVSLFYTPLDGCGKESGWNFTKCKCIYFLASVI